jgi:hypothetical protein
VKLAEEAPKLDADIKAFERTLQPVSKVIGEHAKERNKYQLAYLHQPEAANYQDYVRLKEMGDKLQKEEKKNGSSFSAAPKWQALATGCSCSTFSVLPGPTSPSITPSGSNATPRLTPACKRVALAISLESSTAWSMTRAALSWLGHRSCCRSARSLRSKTRK